MDKKTAKQKARGAVLIFAAILAFLPGALYGAAAWPFLVAGAAMLVAGIVLRAAA